MKTEITAYECCLPLSKRQWNRLVKIGDDLGERYEPSGFDRIVKRLEPLGVVDRTIEFNGHFGRNIFFNVEAGYDIETVEKEIEAMLLPLTQGGMK
jgi:hypothetical protein